MIRWNRDEDLAALAARHDTVILQFGSAACAPCAAIEGRLDAWGKSRGEAVLRYISVEGSPDIAASLGIFSVPAVLVFMQGKLALRECGCFSVDEVLRRTERLMALMKG